MYSKEEVKSELAKPFRPGNADALIPPKINEAVYRSLNPAALTKDLPTRFVQNAFMKASQPFVHVWSTLIKIEANLKAANSPCQIPCSDDFTVDFMQLHKQMDQGLRLLGIVNSQMVVHCKDVLAQFLKKDFKKLCKPHVPFDQWMFSSNLKTLLDDTIRVNRMVQQNKAQPIFKKSFSQGCGPLKVRDPTEVKADFSNKEAEDLEEAGSKTTISSHHSLRRNLATNSSNNK